MRKSKKILSVTLALIMVLGVMVVGIPTMTAGAAGGAAPVSLKSTAYNSNATVTIGWQKGSGGATGFQIAKKKLGDKSYSYFYVGGGNTKSYNDKSVVCGTIYYYQVRTVYKVGNKANYSSWSNCKTITTLYRPTITSLNYLNNNLLNINWNKIKGVSHYKLAFKRISDNAWNYREVKTNYFNVNKPTRGAKYLIQVCPMKGTIAGQWSVVNTKVIGLNFFSPTIRDAYLEYWDDEYIALEWSIPVGYDVREIYYKKATDYYWSVEEYYGYSEDRYADYLSVEDMELEPGNTYYFQVRVVAQDSTGYTYSKFSNVYSYYLPVIEEPEVNNDIVDYSAFCGEDNITLKVWAPDRAVNIVKQQVEDFKAAYPDKTFKKIDVVAQGEGEAGTMLLNDPEVAADVFGFSSDQTNKLADAHVISRVKFANYVSEVNTESTVSAAKVNNKLYAYPETNDNGYYLVYDKSVVSDEQAKTLEGILAACKAKGREFIFDCSDGLYACTFAFTGGVTINGFEDDDYTQKFADYDEAEAVATLQAFSKLMHDYKGTFVSDDCAMIASGFAADTVGAGVDGTWNAAADKNVLGNNFGAAKLPTINVNGQAKQLVPLQGYKYIGVNAYSDYPASAQILALYLSGEKCQRERAAQLGWGPTNKAVQQEAVVKNNPVMNAMIEQEEFAVPMVSVTPTFWYPMGNLGSKLVADNTNPNNVTFFANLLRQTIYNIRDEW